MAAKAFWFLVFLAICSVDVSKADPSTKALQSACDSTVYPEFCVSAIKSYKPGSWMKAARPLDFGKAALGLSIQEAKKVFRLISTLGRWALRQQQRYALDDCLQLFEMTLDQLGQSFAGVGTNSALKWRQSLDVQTWLSAAITNQETCLQSLQEAKGGSLQFTVNRSLRNVTKSLSNSLALVKNITVVGKPGKKDVKRSAPPSNRRRLLWAEKRRRLLEDDGVLAADVVTVAQDGSGNFTTISDAINAAPNKSAEVHVIYVMQGVYEEYVVVPSYKTNIMLVGDGTNATIITGNRSVLGGWTTFRSATFAAVGEGFMARDITFENTAGPENHQAVALRVTSDLSAFYRCAFKGYQDTLYVHSLRQFYRECDIYGTVDFIFGNAAAIFQNCNLYARQPMSGQTTIYTAQGRDDPNQNTGISIQKCTLTLDPDLATSAKGSFKTFLGRPWRNFSRTVVMQSYVDDVVDPSGWQAWSGDQGLSTLYYGEFMNFGPGSGTAGRVQWPGYHIMNVSDAANFTVSNFIAGDSWIQSVPFDVGL